MRVAVLFTHGKPAGGSPHTPPAGEPPPHTPFVASEASDGFGYVPLFACFYGRVTCLLNRPGFAGECLCDSSYRGWGGLMIGGWPRFLRVVCVRLVLGSRRWLNQSTYSRVAQLDLVPVVPMVPWGSDEFGFVQNRTHPARKCAVTSHRRSRPTVRCWLR